MNAIGYCARKPHQAAKNPTSGQVLLVARSCLVDPIEGGPKVAERQEMLVSAVPLALRVERGAGTGALRIVVEGFDPIDLAAHQRLIFRPEGSGVAIEREAVEQ
jgi:hypothetical protein